MDTKARHGLADADWADAVMPMIDDNFACKD
jgi:hypothetical protein